MRTEYLGIACEAMRAEAVIYTGGEMGLRSARVAGTSYAPVGHTPIIRTTGRRFCCTLISAITSRDHLACTLFHGEFDARLFVHFMQ